METKQAELEITLIKKIMQDSRKIIAFNGVDYIVWGILVLIGLLFTYISIVIKEQVYILWSWVILMGIGWIYSLSVHFIGSKEVRNWTLAGKLLGGIWLSSGIAMLIIGFIATFTGAIKGWGIAPTISVILGIAYFASGIIYGHPWVKYLYIGWWGGAVLMYMYPGRHTLLIFAGMMILFQIVPGILFYIKWKKELKEDD